jgi:hypothetical protein
MSIQFTNGPPKSKSEFAAALTELVVEAHRNGVSVLGGWECIDDGTNDGFEAVIVELTQSDD